MNSRIKVKKYLFSLILLFFTSVLFSQQLPYKTIGLKDGLPQSSVFRMAQDKQGYMWLATQGGVCRYDGLNFTTFSIYDGIGTGFIKDLSFDDKGQLWLATFGNGICCYDGKKFININKENGLLSNDIRYFKKTRSNDYFICTIDTGVIWADEYLNQKVILTPENQKILYARTIHELPNGNVWIGYNEGILELQKDKNYSPKHILRNGIEIICLNETSQGEIWAGGTKSLWKYSNKEIIDYSFLLPDYCEVWDISEDKNTGIIYMATTNGVLKKHGDNITWINTENGLSVDDMRCIYQDNYGNMWVGSHSGGLMLLDNKGIDHFGSTSQINRFATNTLIEDDSGNVWIGTNNHGLIYSDGMDVLRPEFISADAVVSPMSSTSDTATGDIWFAEYDGKIVKIKDKKIVYSWTPGGTEPLRLLCITYFNKMLFVSTQDGCYTFNDETHELKKLDEFKDGYYTYSFPDEYGNMWVLGDPGIIYKWINGNIEDFTSSINPSLSKGFHGVYDPYNKLYWFCTYSGLIVWDGVNSFKLHSKNFIKSDSPWSITVDHSGDVWLGHVNGVECLDLKTRTTQFLSYDQGFTPIETNSCSILCDKDGNVWFGTVTSATRIRVNDIKPKKSIVHLWTPQIYVNEQVAFKQDLLMESKNNFDLKYNQNNIAIDLLGICYDNAKDVQYTWYLDGFDKKWNAASTQKKAIYSNLPPGNYVFSAKAIDPNGFESELIKITIIISKPIWNRWWFYALEVLLMAFLIFLSFRFTSNPTQNKIGNLLTLVCILIIFETVLIYVSDYVNVFTGGIPIFQLIMNVMLAGTLQPLEQSIRKFMRKWSIKKRRKSAHSEDAEVD